HAGGLDAGPERLFGSAHQLARLLGDFPDGRSERRIGDVALVGDPQVDADDIPFLQHTVRWDAVHQLLVDGEADRARVWRLPVGRVPLECRLTSALGDRLAGD